MRGRNFRKVKLSELQRENIELVIRKPTSTFRSVQRAKIIQMLANGYTNDAVAKKNEITVPTVCKWRKRAIETPPESIISLEDNARAGRPRNFKDPERMEMISVACEPFQAEGNGRSTPTISEILERVLERGIVKTISRAHLHRILQSGDIHPHRVRMWLHSPDPLFRERVNEICHLYHNPPENSVVLCVDEKTGMQAIERKYPDHSPVAGKDRRQDFEYIRHGTQSLIAAFNIQTGSVYGHCSDTRTGDDLERFMEALAKQYTNVNIHIIWDNLNTHCAMKKRWIPFNKKHQNRFHFHYTPIHASWVNQIELWFGILGKRCLRNSSFRSKSDLRNAVLTWIKQWEEEFKKPFRWKFEGYPLQS